MSLNPSFQSQSMSILLQIKLFRFGELRPLPSSWGQFSPFFWGGKPGVCDAIEEELFDEILSSKGAKPDFFADATVK